MTDSSDIAAKARYALRKWETYSVSGCWDSDTAVPDLVAGLLAALETAETERDRLRGIVRAALGGVS